MSYSESVLERKLADLNNSQQSIQQLSLWLIHHRKHHSSIVSVWYKQVLKASPAKKLTFIYLVNDVVQNSKKKYPEYANEFGPAVRKVFEHLSESQLEDKTIKSIARVLNIWQERGIFESKLQTELQRIWTKKSLTAAISADIKDEPKTPPAKKIKTETPTKDSQESHDKTTEAKINALTPKSKSTSSSRGSTPVERSSTPNGADPPEPEELIKALQELENSASSDAVVREKIARLPPELSEPSYLDSLKSYEEGQKLLVKVNEATELLSSYNDRLQQELKDRRKVGKMVAGIDFREKACHKTYSKAG